MKSLCFAGVNPKLLIVLIVVAVAAVAFNAMRYRGPKEPQRWYYDLQESELIAVTSSTNESPITLDSGHEAVAAIVYSCGDCADESQHFIGYLSKIEYVAAGPAGGPTDAGTMPLSLVRRESDEQWHNASTPQGMAIVAEAQARCQGKVQVCDPQ